MPALVQPLVCGRQVSFDRLRTAEVLTHLSPVSKSDVGQACPLPFPLRVAFPARSKSNSLKYSPHYSTLGVSLETLQFCLETLHFDLSRQTEMVKGQLS